MKTIGHHTCRKDGGREYVQQAAPFQSKYDEKDDLYPFLGTGYYFWDNNLEYARWWGIDQKKRFPTGYFVVEAELNLAKGIFLDLVGSMDSIYWFRRLMARLKTSRPEVKDWSVASFIEFAKKLNRVDNQAFPFKVIRAVDHSRNHNPKKNKWLLRFVKKKQEYTNLDPRLVICLLEKDNVILQNKVVVVES